MSERIPTSPPRSVHDDCLGLPGIISRTQEYKSQIQRNNERMYILNSDVNKGFKVLSNRAMPLQLTSDAICSSKKGNIRSSKPVFVKTGMCEAEASRRGVRYNTSATTSLSYRLISEILLYYVCRELLLSIGNFQALQSLNFTMSSSAVSKKSSEEVAPSTRSGTIDSREHTTKASASVCVCWETFDQGSSMTDSPCAS